MGLGKLNIETVLVIREGEIIMENIMVVPIDDSTFSHDALRFALTLAKDTKSKIIILNVQPNMQTANVQRFFNKDEITAYAHELGKEVLDKTEDITKDTSVPIEKVIRIGSPKQEICDLAREQNARCIVMGSRGRGFIKGAVLGSVSYGVLQVAPCPVTIVP